LEKTRQGHEQMVQDRHRQRDEDGSKVSAHDSA
jgi:hypothetical protein